MTLKIFSDQFVGLYFSTSYFLWNDRFLLPRFLSSLIKDSNGDCPFPQFSTVSFLASLCSSSVIHWLNQSNRPDGFIIWDFRPVFSVTVLVVSRDQGQYQSLAEFLHFRVLSCLPDLLIVSQELTRVSFKYIFFSCNIGRKCWSEKADYLNRVWWVCVPAHWSFLIHVCLIHSNPWPLLPL